MNKDLDKLKGAIQMCCNMLNRSGRPAQQEAADELKAALGEFCEAARATSAQPVVECSYLRTPGTHCNKCGEVHGSPLHWTGAIAYTVWQWRKRGEMVWHDADQEVAACGGDEYEYRCLYTKEGVPAHQPSPSSVGDAIRAMPLPEPLEIDWPQLNSNALGCGVEDRNIRDRYEAAEYGWQDGVDKAAERVPDDIYTADQVRELLSKAAALAEQVQGQQVGHPPCKGPNCGTTNSSHSLECQATHEAACAGGYFIKRDVLTEIIGCFQAAEIEGLRDVLSETTDERLKDLVERRLMFAYEAALNAAPSIAQDGQKSEGA